MVGVYLQLNETKVFVSEIKAREIGEVRKRDFSHCVGNPENVILEWTRFTAWDKKAGIVLRSDTVLKRGREPLRKEISDEWKEATDKYRNVVKEIEESLEGVSIIKKGEYHLGEDVNIQYRRGARSRD